VPSCASGREGLTGNYLKSRETKNTSFTRAR
jgi:hypothetical protein